MTTVTIETGGDHLYMAFIYAGLIRLQQQKLIRLAFVGHHAHRPVRQSLVLAMSVERDGSSATICIDVADADRMTITDAGEYDFYFKRNYRTAALADQPLRKRIHPFGLIFPCRYSTLLRSMRNLYNSTVRHVRPGASLKHRLGQWYNYWRLPELSAYEYAAHLPGEGYILYQTRAWNPGNYEHWQEINESRLALIQALQSRFQERFVGGFMPDAFARRHYPQAVTTFPTSRRRYVELIKRAQVCVYSRGLFDSPAFKMGEYLAAGRCIVAEPLANELPEPLQAGRHYLPFHTVDECVQQCELLLQNREQALAMQRHNMAYYQQQVEPSRQMERVLNLVLPATSAMLEENRSVL